MAVSRISQQSLINAFPKGNTVWDGTTAPAAMDVINSVLVPSGGLVQVVFNNIPQTYTHLQIRGICLSSSANNAVAMRFNYDAASNYSYHGIDAPGVSTPTSYASAPSSYAAVGYTGDSSYPSNFVCDIFDYNNGNKFKTTRCLSGNDANSTATRYITIASSNWRNSAAITSITLFHGSGGTAFNEHSYFSLYGIK